MLLWMVGVNSMLTVMGGVLLYLSSDNQQWLAHALSKTVKQGVRVSSCLLLLLSCVLWMWNLPDHVGFFVWLTILMVLLGSLPFVSLLFAKASAKAGAP